MVEAGNHEINSMKGTVETPLGAMKLTVDKKGRIKREKKPLKIYVKAKNKIGRFVIGLTGITEQTLKEKNKSIICL